MSTLIINAHPNISDSLSYTERLKQLFVEKYVQKFDKQNLDVINLYDEIIPILSENELLGIWRKEASNDVLTRQETLLLETSHLLLSQFKKHDHIVIATPLHNFNIPSRLKDYLDNILIAKETFKYTDSGSVGLMNDHKCLLLESSGGIYTTLNQVSHLDFLNQYLTGVFTDIMAFNDFLTVRAEGTDELDQTTVLKSSQLLLNECFKKFYN